MSKICKWCNGSGKETPKREENKEIKIFGNSYGGFKINTPCKKCNGTGRRTINDRLNIRGR